MKKKLFLSLIISFLISLPITFTASSCSTSNKTTHSPAKYHHYRTKQSNWNTTTSTTYKHVIKNKKRKKYQPK